MGEQGHDEGHGLCRGAQPIEGRAFGGAERLVTRVTDEPLLLLRMDTDIALAGLASGRASEIRAEYRGGVHDDSPLLVVLGSMPRRSMSGPPFPLQSHSTTVQCGATGLSALSNFFRLGAAQCRSNQKEEKISGFQRKIR